MNLKKQLSELGEPDYRRQAVIDGLDYVSQMNLTAEHIPQLMELACNTDFDEMDSEDLDVQIHAWRALGHLKAVECVQPLLENIDTELDAPDYDECLSEDLPIVLSLIGPPAVESLTDYLGDEHRNEFARMSACESLQRIAARHPESRSEVIRCIEFELKKFSTNYTLNAALIDDLVELESVDSAEVIERAFAADVVDLSYAGTWGSIRERLGVESLGLVEDSCPGGYRAFPLPKPKGLTANQLQRKQAESRDRQKRLKAEKKSSRKQKRKAKKRQRGRQ